MSNLDFPLLTVSRVEPCRDTNYGYVYVAEAPSEKFFIQMARAVEAGLLNGPAIVDGGDLLAWKTEASKTYNTPGRVPGTALPDGYARVKYAAPNKKDARKTSVYLEGVDKGFVIHPDTIKKEEPLAHLANIERGQLVNVQQLQDAVHRSQNMFKSADATDTGNYNPKDWAREAYSTGRMEQFIRDAFPGVPLEITRLGKGSGETVYLDSTQQENKEAGVPDMRIRNPETGWSVLLECTGSEMMGKKDDFHLREDTKEKADRAAPWAKPGEDLPNKFAELWVRPDKIEYARNHSDTKVYIGFHFPQQFFEYDLSDKANPTIIGRAEKDRTTGERQVLPVDPSKEVMGFVLPQLDKAYTAYNWFNKAKDSTERFCAFYMKDPEYLSPKAFLSALADDLGLPQEIIKVPAYKESGPAQDKAPKKSKDFDR